MTKRRQRIHRDIRRYAHPRAKMEKGLTKFQLAAIGAVALAYNELEVAVDLRIPPRMFTSAKVISLNRWIAQVLIKSVLKDGLHTRLRCRSSKRDRKNQWSRIPATGQPFKCWMRAIQRRQSRTPALRVPPHRIRAKYAWRLLLCRGLASRADECCEPTCAAT